MCPFPLRPPPLITPGCRYLIDLILSAGEEDDASGYQMDDVTIRDNVISFFGAGTETSATALSWAWSQLLKHPDVSTLPL